MNSIEPQFHRLKVQIIFAFALFTLPILPVLAQDIHFSQLHAVPIHLNPANTGTGETDFRFFNLYRNQWRRIDVPYTTLQFAADKKMLLWGRQFGIGGVVVHDESSSLSLVANKFHFSLSHAFYYRTHRLVLALQPGFVVKQYNSRNLTFGSQFDENSEIFDPSLPSNENQLSNSMQYFDLNAGLLWQSRIKTWKPALGVSMHHINQPVESFYSSNDSTRLPVKMLVNGQIYIPLLEKYSIEPQFIYSTTKGANEFLFGAMGTYYTQAEVTPVKKIYAISHFRVNPLRTFDSFVVGAGLQFNSFDFCFSYDFNVSPLRKATKYRGAFEISIIYLRNPRPEKTESEPCFML